MKNARWGGIALFVGAIAITWFIRSAMPGNDPLGSPAEFAWRNLAMSSGSSDPKGGWEHWSSNLELFTGHAPNCRAPGPSKVLVQSVEFTSMSMARSPKSVAPPLGEFELRFNQIACESVVSQGLFALGGRMDAFRKGRDVQFTDGSIAIKGRWESGACTPVYHCGVDSNGRSVRLIAVHIAVKHRVTPNWFWATWEHDSVVHQPEYGGMCCKDRFGEINGQASPNLQRLLRNNGLGREWQHYHLVGTQTDYESNGSPTFLGNAAIEINATKRSSCITCHARASTDAIGATMNIFRCDTSCDPHGTGGNTHQCEPRCLLSYYGKPDLVWYLDGNGRLQYVRVGFLWSVLDGGLPVLLRIRN